MGGLFKVFEFHREKELRQRICKHLIAREGCREVVYMDHLGHPTVGTGHLVTDEDRLVLGARVSISRIEKFLKEDIEIALRAARRQAEEMGAETDDFILALTSVNFQLGTRWPRKFYETYPLLVEGDWKAAIDNIRKSLWAEQTPLRAADFIAAIESAFTRRK